MFSQSYVYVSAKNCFVVMVHVPFHTFLVIYNMKVVHRIKVYLCR
jgi:hypothetical protein